MSAIESLPSDINSNNAANNIAHNSAANNNNAPSHDWETQQKKKKEIYTYQAPWTVYSMAWRKHPDGKFQLAIGSFLEEYANQFHIVQLTREEDAHAAKDPLLPAAHHPNNTTNTTTAEGHFTKLSSFDHPYPATKVSFAPAKYFASQQNSSANNHIDLLATSGDYLRLWNVQQDYSIQMKGVLNNNKHTEYCAPLTSFDWNETEPSMIGSCSIDTTCTIWDINVMLPRTQLIAHDKEVYDIAFACGKDVFGTVGADGSLRMFDLRALEHSTILYETPDLSPLCKLVWNKQDPNYIATMLTEANKTIVIDIRMPTYPVAELVGHTGAINGIAWAPHSANHLCTVGDDYQALIWDISVKNVVIEDPILAFSAQSEINGLQWCSSHEDWVAISFQDSLQILKV